MRLLRLRRLAVLAIASSGLLSAAGCAVNDTAPAGDSEPAAPTTTPAPPTPAPAATPQPAPATPPVTVATPAPSATAAPPPPTTPAPAPAPAPPPVAYSVEEIQAVVSPAAAAWAHAPSGPTYEALAGSARSVIDSGRPLPATPAVSPEQLRAALTQLAAYPGNDAAVVAAFDVLRPIAPGLPAVINTPPPPPPPPPVAPQPAVDLGRDPLFDSCRDAIAAGYGPYRRGDAEYPWYDDRDNDGIVCE